MHSPLGTAGGSGFAASSTMQISGNFKRVEVETLFFFFSLHPLVQMAVLDAYEGGCDGAI